MGQQQLLLIVLGVIIVGIAVVVGITLFQANSIEAKRNNIIDECLNLAALAQNYYLKPVSIGGGGQSFTGWSIPAAVSSTLNGTYITATVTADSVLISATGTDLVSADTPVEVALSVYPKTYRVRVVH